MKSFLRFVILLFVMPVVATAGMTFDIALKESVEIEKETFLLSDVAVLSGSNPAMLEKLNSLKLGKSPKYGFSKQYSYNDVEKVISSHYSDKVDLQWSSQKTSTVTRRGEKLYLSELKTELENKALMLVKSKDDGLSEFKITDVIYKEYVYLPSDNYSFELVFPKAVRINKRLTGLMDFYIHDKRVKTMPVTFEIEAIRPIHIAKNDLERRTEMNIDDYELAYKDVSNIYDEVAAPKDNYNSLILANNKSKHSILMKSEIMMRPLVMKGEATSVTVFGEKVNIQSFGVAQNDANQGERVVLMNTSGALFNAVVADKGEAYVH